MGRPEMTAPVELYACLYVREFPAQALLRLRPELQEKPCVVMEGERPTQTLCSLNAKARSAGLTHGMSAAEVDLYRIAVVLFRSRKIEAEVRAVLLECASGFSPRVEDRSEDTAFLCAIDIAGTTNLFGPPETLAQTLLERAKALDIVVCVTVSTNLHAAVCLARGLPPRVSIQVIRVGEESRTLATLPISVLDLTEKQSDTFAVWGIRTLGMLTALPEKDLIARMGQAGKRLGQLAHGELPHLFQPIEPVFVLEEYMELDSPVEDLEALLFVIAVLLDQLIARAKARIFALAAVTVTLLLSGGATHVRTVRPALPDNDKALWLKLLHLDLEAHSPSAAIVAMKLQAEPGNKSKVQLGLFSPQLPEPARLDVTLARIRAIVGDDCVGRAVLQNTHAPESFRLEPFTVPSGVSNAPPSTRSLATVRQLRPAETVAVKLEGRRPTQFYFRKQRYTVERAYGPWLMGGDWWNASLWGQEQWELIARAQSHVLYCCLMRDRLEDIWQVTALYD
jgi:protein ImuB